MSRVVSTVFVLAAVLAAGTGGYWLAQQRAGVLMLSVAGQPAQQPSGPVIYYQDPDGKPSYSAEPKRTADGRPYRAVYASEDVSFDEPEQQAATSAPAGRKILYYRHPMGLPDVSKAPKKDSMGMDYIPVYEGEDADSTTVRVSAGKLQRIGVSAEPATLRAIAVPVRAPGTIQLDERRMSVISLRSEAFLEKVEDVTTGTMVRKGQPLLQLYSPAIASAAADYAAQLGSRGDTPLHGSRQRLMNLAPPPHLIEEVERTRKVPLTFTWTSPRDGIVLERNVSDGMRVTPGDVLFRIADHSHVWATVDVAERDLAAVAEGQSVIVQARSYPDRRFSGKVALVYPHLNAATRSVRVRIELPNPDYVLLPDMYVEAEIDTGIGRNVVAVPENAVIDSGSRQLVIIDKGEGRFEPRPVVLGRRGAGYVEVKEGVAEGDNVVTSANFLIDAESNLKAALRGLADGGAPQ
jgi:membrane fusion protein, copper/silver efflux system